MAEPQIASDMTDDFNTLESTEQHTSDASLDNDETTAALSETQTSDADSDTVSSDSFDKTSNETSVSDESTSDDTPSASDDDASDDAQQRPAIHDTGRPRKWHFQPEIHMTIAEQKLPMLLNTETGELEMPKPLRMDLDCLLRFLNGIADGELSSLEQSIASLNQFVSLERFTLTALTVAPTGELSFNLAAHPEPQSDCILPTMSFDNIRFTVSKELQS